MIVFVPDDDVLELKMFLKFLLKEIHMMPRTEAIDSCVGLQDTFTFVEVCTD